MKVIHGYWIMALDSHTCKLDTDTCQLHNTHDTLQNINNLRVLSCNTVDPAYIWYCRAYVQHCRVYVQHVEPKCSTVDCRAYVQHCRDQVVKIFHTTVPKATTFCKAFFGLAFPQLQSFFYKGNQHCWNLGCGIGEDR